MVKKLLKCALHESMFFFIHTVSTQLFYSNVIFGKSFDFIIFY